MEDLDSLCVFLDSSMEEAMACIDRGQRGIALVVDEERRLEGTITDGDVRRALLARMDLQTPVRLLLVHKVNTSYPVPITAPVGTEPERLLRIMRQRQVRHLPLLDDRARVVGLATQDDLLPQESLKLHAVIMAGGLGTRLRPLTEELPKPMLPVGGRPVMERIIERLKQAGIRRVNVMTHYKPEKIMEYFGNGDAFGVTLEYVREEEPLGTGGSLALIDVPQETILVINGDILTEVDFRAMLSFHQEASADMTVAVCSHSLHVPYGVIDCEGSLVRKVSEKPRLNLLINSGIYLLEPCVFSYLPRQGRFDMTELIQSLLDGGRPVAGFPIREYWIDIGAHTDYRRAESDVIEHESE